MILKAIGFIAGFCFAICGVPAAWFSWYDGEASTPLSVALPIFLGAVLMFIYLTVQHGWDSAIVCTYVTEIISWGIVVWFWKFPRKPYVSTHA